MGVRSALRASVHLRDSNTSASQFGAKHGAPHLARPKKGLPPSDVPPPSCVSNPLLRFSAFPWRGRLTTPGSGEHKALPLTEGRPGIFPTSRVTGVDSNRAPGPRQGQQRESYQHGGSNESYPRLTRVPDKEQIFSRQKLAVISPVWNTAHQRSCFFRSLLRLESSCPSCCHSLMPVSCGKEPTLLEAP